MMMMVLLLLTILPGVTAPELESNPATLVTTEACGVIFRHHVTSSPVSTMEPVSMENGLTTLVTALELFHQTLLWNSLETTVKSHKPTPVMLDLVNMEELALLMTPLLVVILVLALMAGLETLAPSHQLTLVQTTPNTANLMVSVFLDPTLMLLLLLRSVFVCGDTLEQPVELHQALVLN